MRKKYLDVVDEVEVLKSDFDAVSRDLEQLSKGQDVELHATFNKFGKTANLQVHDAPVEGEEDEKRYTGLKLFKVPSVRQVSTQNLQGVNGSISIRACCTEVSRWRRRDQRSCSLICFTLV